MTFDELIEQQPPDVEMAILSITAKAGTTDADWSVLLAAGQEVARLRKALTEVRDKDCDFGCYLVAHESLTQAT